MGDYFGHTVSETEGYPVADLAKVEGVVLNVSNV